MAASPIPKIVQNDPGSVAWFAVKPEPAALNSIRPLMRAITSAAAIAIMARTQMVLAIMAGTRFLGSDNLSVVPNA